MLLTADVFLNSYYYQHIHTGWWERGNNNKTLRPLKLAAFLQARNVGQMLTLNPTNNQKTPISLKQWPLHFLIYTWWNSTEESKMNINATRFGHSKKIYKFFMCSTIRTVLLHHINNSQTHIVSVNLQYNMLQIPSLSQDEKLLFCVFTVA